MSISIALLLASAPITIITASSTNDAPAACLLENKCTWGGGVDEGIGFRFSSALDCSTLEVALKSPSSSAPLDASFGAYGVELASKDGGKTWSSACYPSTSLFLRVLPQLKPAPVDIASVRFLSNGKPSELSLPKAVKATVTATSVLTPVTAYQPAFLFDSKTDLAWASDGKKTNGVGVVISVTFDEPQEIGGLMLWNGYQRSETHFEANSRVSKLTLKTETKSAAVAVRASAGMTQEKLAEPLPPSKKIDVVINEVAAGAKYKDLVISELRFLDKAGRVIAPVVPVEKTPASAEVAPLLDKSYAGVVASVADSSAMGPYCVDRRLRVRSGGSFVIYTGDENAPDGNGVIEGGWESGKQKSSLRVFGKKYRTVITQGEYAGIREVVPEIFQSDLVLAPFASLSAADQANVVDVVYDLAGAGDRSFKTERKMFARDGSVLASATSYADLKKALTKALADKGAIAAKSSVYTDALLPTDVAGACKR